MAVDPKWLKKWIAGSGPYLYHRSTDCFCVSSILGEGLVPWNRLEAPKAGGCWQPRPDHIYMGTKAALEAAGWHRGDEDEIVRIDLRHLDPENLNPDEDAFYSDVLPGAPFLGLQPGLGLESASATVRDDSYVLSVEDEKSYPLEGRPYASYGEWAEANCLGSNPEHTRLSLECRGVLAHHGRIPPEAISHHRSVSLLDWLELEEE